MPIEPEPITAIFRVFKSGMKEVIALFPEVVADNYPPHCLSYMHVGQHGAADYDGVIRGSRPATPEESAPLRRELESLFEYVITEKKRASYAMYKKRYDEIHRTHVIPEE
jgi:hypothetical protein